MLRQLEPQPDLLRAPLPVRQHLGLLLHLRPWILHVLLHLRWPRFHLDRFLVQLHWRCFQLLRQHDLGIRSALLVGGQILDVFVLSYIRIQGTAVKHQHQNPKF